jgi:hypothetical protein
MFLMPSCCAVLFFSESSTVTYFASVYVFLSAPCSNMILLIIMALPVCSFFYIESGVVCKLILLDHVLHAMPLPSPEGSPPLLLR